MLKPKILFIHHSTGGNLIKQGKLREQLYSRSNNIQFWDHNYNLYPFLSRILARFTHHKGLSDPEGKITGEDFQIHLNNNNPKDYERIFTSDPSERPLRDILDFDVVIFKKCFPTSGIESDEKLESFKASYRNMREAFVNHPDKLFIVMTQPPLRREVTNSKEAKRARELATWLGSSDFNKAEENIKTFDFFDLLADSEGENINMLKREYCPWFPRDSHPNKRANLEIRPVFAEFIVNSLK